MARRKIYNINTDYMFNGCSNMDAPNLSLHSISECISSMDYMFYGAGLPQSTAMDGEHVRFNSLLSCRSAFEKASFAFDGTTMQFYGATGDWDADKRNVGSIKSMFRGNYHIKDKAPMVLLSRNGSLTSTSAIEAAINNRFVSDGGDVTVNDIYSKSNSAEGIYDFSYLYADSNIGSVDMRGICNSLAASSVLNYGYSTGELEAIPLSAHTPSVSAGGWTISYDGYDGCNALVCNDIPKEYRKLSTDIFNRYAITERDMEDGSESDPHIRKFLRISHEFPSGDFTLSFKYRLDKTSEYMGYEHVQLNICNGIENEGTEDERYVYDEFSIHSGNGTVKRLKNFNGGATTTPDSNGWYSVSYHCTNPSDIRIVLWNFSPSHFENVMISDMRITATGISTSDGNFFKNGDAYGSFKIYREYIGYNIGKIDFSHMFDCCSSLRTYTGFIPQYGSTYAYMFAGCANLDVNLSDMFKNYYPSDASTVSCRLSAIAVDYTGGGTAESCPSTCWERDAATMYSGSDSIRLHDESVRENDAIGSFFALVSSDGQPIRFKPRERIRISFSYMDDVAKGSVDDDTLTVDWFVGFREAGSASWKRGQYVSFHTFIDVRGKWACYENEFRVDDAIPADNALVFGIRGSFSKHHKLWISNIVIDTDLKHVRASNFGDKQISGSGYYFGYGAEQHTAGTSTAYNTNTYLEGYCMSSIGYMFTKCGNVRSSDDRFDLVSVVKRTAETLTRMGRDPEKSESSFMGAFPCMRLGLSKPIDELASVTYGLDGISRKYGIVRYCSYSEDDIDKFGVDTNMMKWSFSNGFLRYGGILTNNTNQFIIIPYYRIENANGDFIGLAPHISNKENGLTPDAFRGTYRRGAAFRSKDSWVANMSNPFIGGDADSYGDYVTYNWVEHPNNLYGAYVYDIDGNFIRKAYVGEWSEHVYMKAYNEETERYAYYTIKAHYNKPVSTFSGNATVEIPDIGTVKMQSDTISERNAALLIDNECVIDEFSGVTYVWKPKVEEPQPYVEPVVVVEEEKVKPVTTIEKRKVTTYKTETKRETTVTRDWWEAFQWASCKYTKYKSKDGWSVKIWNNGYEYVMVATRTVAVTKTIDVEVVTYPSDKSSSSTSRKGSSSTVSDNEDEWLYECP